MKNLITCLLIIVFSSAWSSAQSTFQKGISIGNVDPGPIRELSDGGYIAVCGTDSFSLSSYGYMYIAKFDSLGDTLWTHYYSRLFANDVRQFSDSNILITGLDFNGFTTGDTSFNFLINLNLAGDTNWTREYTGNTNASANNSLDITYDNKIISVGATFFGGLAWPDGYFFKIDNNGDTIWTKQFGGSNDDELISLVQAPDSGYVLAGSTQSFGSGGKDVYVLKINSIGDTVWTRAFGTPADESASAIVLSSDSNFIITGTCDDGISMDVFLMKISNLGNLIWIKRYGGNSTYEEAHHLINTNDNGFLIAGATEFSNLFAIKTDSNGDTLWTKVFDLTTNSHYSTGSGCIHTRDGGFTFTASNLSGLIILKTDSFGNGACNYLSYVFDVNQPLWQNNFTNTVISSNFIYGKFMKENSTFGTPVTYCKNIVGINFPAIENHILVSPNPAIRGSKMKIDIADFSDVYTLRIFDIFGKEIKHINNVSGGNLEISTNDFSDGLYLFEMEGKSQMNHLIGKFVITTSLGR